MNRNKLASLIASAILASAMAAAAQEETGGSLSFSTSEGASAEGSASGGSWMSRNTPEAGLAELGIFGGLFFPAEDHNLRDTNEAQIAFKSIAPEIGLRAAYFPLSFLGAEGEGAMMFAKTEDDTSATLTALRLHAIGQIPGARITPFALVGFGDLAVSSDTLGSDGDPSFHFGAGAKAALTRKVSLRLDVRDNVTSANPDSRESTSDDAHHPEVLLGVSLVLGRSPEQAPPPPPQDTDGDGFDDPEDSCPNEPGVAPDGCPIPDTDEDGFKDPDDACPEEPGVEPDGCPDKDPDEDGVLIPDDQCPKVAGVPPDGCPDKDPDKDGILDPDDKCPNDPETKNGYEDTDGCPDEVPEEVKKFTGVIKGIEFDVNKATIRPLSRPTLDDAVKVLKEYETIRILITGHTDSDGPDDKNLDLSKRRAEAVKQYLVDKGIDDKRIETRGAGEAEPLAKNDTPQGKQKNRRIEFKLLEQ